MTSPGDVTANYVEIMAERGWSWDDLADEFERQADGPPRPLDGGANARGMAAWARQQGDAGRAAEQRRAAAEQPTDRGPTTDGEDTEVWDEAARRAVAAEQRRDAADQPDEPDPRPDDAVPDAPPRKAVPPPKRRG